VWYSEDIDAEHPGSDHPGNARPRAAGDRPRLLQVAPQRLARWLGDFERRHDVVLTTYESSRANFQGRDGALAECEPPFPPLTETGPRKGFAPEPLVRHVERERVVGVLLVRLGGYAAGVFEGDRLLASRVGARQVHGRSAAGGRSQLRFARRRELQGRRALEAAAGNAVRVLLPELDRLEAVVLGGDRRAIDFLRQDPRMASLFALATDRFLAVPEPRLAVLRTTPPMFRAVRVLLHDPSS
jgi:hypothetical protein